MTRRSLVFVAVIVATAVPAPVAIAGAATRNNPVILVHGINPIPVGGFGSPCSFFWNPLKDALAGWGWHRNELIDVKYYAGDSACADDINHNGSHNAHYGNRLNHSLFESGAHTERTPIEHLGYHLAWYIYDHYTSRGRSVALVGHSMGGLIIRYALTREQAHDPEFPPRLRVGDVVSLESPYAGASISLICPWSMQCREMNPGAAFLRGLGDDPQGTGGTDWTTIGSNSDPIVGVDSAVAMGAPHRMKYVQPSYGHFRPLFDGRESLDAQVDRSEDGGAWVRQIDAPHSIKQVDLALAGSAD